MKISALFVLVLGGCAPKPSADQSASAAAQIVVTGTADATASAPTSDETHVHVRAGLFLAEKIETCIDLDMNYPTKEAADKAIGALKTPLKSDKTGKATTFFPAGCAESFSDRTALASCQTKKNKGTATATYYMVEGLDGDKSMRECMSNGGKWQAIGHDTDAYQLAEAEAEQRKAEADQRKAEQELKKLTGK